MFSFVLFCNLQYPLFLPCFVSSVLSVLILIMVLLFLPESLTKDMRKENVEEMKKSQARYRELKALMKKNPDYVPSIMYGIYAIIQGGQDAVYPVWLINSQEHHGFGFTSSDLGWMYTGLSPIQIFSTPLLFPLITRLMDRKTVSYFTGIAFSLLLFISPVAALANTSSVPVPAFFLFHM